jgi:hypothetical protein
MNRPGEEVTEFWFERALSETPVMRGPGVAIVFSRARGFSHALRVGKGASSEAIELEPKLLQAASVPDEADDQFDGRQIGNPLYQELVPHEQGRERGRGTCALLTGSCFNHHFSGVFSLGWDQDAPDRLVFDVDVADRCRGPVEKLAATYVVTGADVAIEAETATANSLIFRVGRGLLELAAAPPAIIDAPGSSGGGIRIQIQARIDPQTHTQRLHYRWRWASCEGLTRLTA